MNNLSADTCVKHLGQSFLIGRRALGVELAVCLSIFAGAGNTERSAKQLVQEVYKRAGYDADNKHSRHYKTVNRRLNAAAALYNKLGHTVVAGWMDGHHEDKLIVAVTKGLETHKFDSLDDVLEFCGVRNNRTREFSRVSGNMVRFGAGGVHVELPLEMSAENMLKLAAKIIDSARKKEQKDILNSIVTVTRSMEPGLVAMIH